MSDINWSDILNKFSQSETWKEMKGKQKVTITREEYEAFCKEYIFDKLKGKRFGRAFCERFGITDRTISILTNEAFTKQLIESLGYIK